MTATLDPFCTNGTSPPGPSPRPSNGWNETIGDGIRRDHRVGCPATTSRRRGIRCDCPYSFWKPTTLDGRRERARVYGTLHDARRAKRLAEHHARDLRQRRSNQRAGIMAMPTLDEWYQSLLTTEWSRKRPGTLDRRRVDYQYRLKRQLGSKRLDQLTIPIVRSWLDDLLRRDGNRRCVQAAHDTLCAMLAVAVDHDLLAENTAKRVRYPIEGLEHREQHALDRDEYEHLLAACRNASERTILRVLCEAGLRRSEVAALQIGDLHLDDGLIHIQRRHYRCADGSVDVDAPKSHKPRWAAISASLVAELREAIAGRENAADAPVWLRQTRYTDEQPVTHNGTSIYKLLKRLGRHANLDVSPHMLRATGASLAVAAGVPEHIAARQLGHARVDTTRKHYLRLPVIEPLRQIGAVFE